MPAIRSSNVSVSDGIGKASKRVRVFCTRCRVIKELVEFDGHQLDKRFGKSKTVGRRFKSYDPEHEREKGAKVGSELEKIWCQQCVPKEVKQAWCCDCEQYLPRSSFSQAQLKGTKTDNERLCQKCSQLTLDRAEAAHMGNHSEMECIDQKLNARAETGAADKSCMACVKEEEGEAGEEEEKGEESEEEEEDDNDDDD